MQLKIVLIVGDGMADRPVKELKGRTPLEEALRPNIDELARKSALGLWDPIGPGIRPGSDTAHLALFGYDPYKYYPGRGPFEALGSGAELRPGDVALRGNFATVNDDLIVIDRRAGRTLDENQELARYLNENIGAIDDVEVRFYPATEHRIAVVLRGGTLSANVSDTDPHEVGARVLQCKALSNDEGAIKTARIINELTLLTHKLLREHPANLKRISKGLPPANIVLLRGAGKMTYIPKLHEREEVVLSKYIAISATALIKGVTRLLGFDVVTPPGATGGLDTNVMSKASAAIRALEEGYELVYVHVKGTDAASHDGNVAAKIRMIEEIDRMIGKVVDSIDLGSVVLAVTADHVTPTSVRDHVGDPVPVMVYSPYLMPDGLSSFCERTARKGSLGRLRLADLFYTLLDQANRIRKYGA